MSGNFGSGREGSDWFWSGGSPFDMFDRVMGGTFGDLFRSMENELGAWQSEVSDLQFPAPQEGGSSLRQRMLSGGEGLGVHDQQSLRQQLLTDNNDLVMDAKANAYFDPPDNVHEIEKEAPKSNWMTLWGNIDMDEDRPPITQSFSSFSSSTTINGGQGHSFESKRTVRDVHGNIETTISKRSGNEETTVVVKRKPDGTEEKFEQTIDLTSGLSSVGPTHTPGPLPCNPVGGSPNQDPRAGSGWLSWLRTPWSK